MVHLIPRFPGMNSPAISEVSRPVPLFPRLRPLAIPPRSLPAREGPAPAPKQPGLVLEPNLSRRGPAREVVAAALLLLGWTLLWGFFITAVAEPGAQLGTRAATHASVAPAP
jgi:hypothetical protein